MAKELLQYIPFVGLAVQGVQHHQNNPAITRLMEAAIIGAVTMYGAVQVIGAKVDALSTQVIELKQDQKKMQDTITQLRVAVGK